MILVDTIALDTLREMSSKMSEPMVKGVVDIALRKLVVDAGLHSDEEQLLLEQGSAQENLWGINLWPEYYGTDEFVEFDSMINIRPAQNNRSRGVEDEAIQKCIVEVVEEKVHG